MPAAEHDPQFAREFPALAQSLTSQLRVERELGRGGMGVVYLARDERLDRFVALKVLPTAHASEPTTRERFLREARTAARLAHPNIVPIYRADEAGGTAFFAMAFVSASAINFSRSASGSFGTDFFFVAMRRQRRHTAIHFHARKCGTAVPMLSAVIAGPVEGVGIDEAAAAIEKATGLRAFVNRDFGDNDKDFNTSTIWWYVRNTGIPISFGTTVIIGFIVGVAISCQTFYAFVLDNLKHLGALKAMGMSNFRLSLMLLTQSFTVGLIGFGLGLLATSGFAWTALEKQQPPFYMPWIIPVVAFGVIQFICMLAALMGIVRLSLYEPAQVFRA